MRIMRRAPRANQIVVRLKVKASIATSTIIIISHIHGYESERSVFIPIVYVGYSNLSRKKLFLLKKNVKGFKL